MNNGAAGIPANQSTIRASFVFTATAAGRCPESANVRSEGRASPAKPLRLRSPGTLSSRNISRQCQACDPLRVRDQKTAFMAIGLQGSSPIRSPVLCDHNRQSAIASPLDSYSLRRASAKP